MTVLRRIPLTLAVFVITAVPSLLQFAYPGVLTSLQRTPAIRDGQVWRLVTSLVVQDGGWFGAASNLFFLLLVGALAELTLRRWLWATCYVGCGLVAEGIALAWEPTGGGNSIAICGLAGALTVALLTRPLRPSTAWRPEATGEALHPRHLWLPAGVAWWSVALLGTVSELALYIGVAAGAAVQVALVAGGETGRGNRTLGRIVAAGALAVGITLTALRNIHGPPLLLGAALTYAASRR
ncbi:rhomboid family intramembrane serine protease [Asanoa sp. WMMD1127]|uniref:rhomboid family intramembrane serine protease n=1 Tax=Asanoa sp. WMMD1127 TaxID=3016107 RepID=UPI002417A953|nr:rhomboid family intramembrane serine protease [Asanoa sp. WMMD1127]MDG4822757.1 rhomboid family intramembrane serine protease [Asanoa sp. WMMD1127]